MKPLSRLTLNGLTHCSSQVFRLKNLWRPKRFVFFSTTQWLIYSIHVPFQHRSAVWCKTFYYSYKKDLGLFFLTTIINRIFEANFLSCKIVHYGKRLISSSSQILTSIDKIFTLGGKLATGYNFMLLGNSYIPFL